MSKLSSRENRKGTVFFSITALSHLFAIHSERSASAFADAATVVSEVEGDCVLARRQLLIAGEAPLALVLIGILAASWFEYACTNIGLPSSTS